MTCSDTRSRNPGPRTKTYEIESSVAVITFSVASGGPQSANSYLGGHQVSTVQDAYAVTVMHDTCSYTVGRVLGSDFQQNVRFNSVHLCEVVGASL